MGVYFTGVALTLYVSVNIDIRGKGESPTLTTSRTSVDFTDAGILGGAKCPQRYGQPAD